MSLQFVKSQKGSDHLVYNGYRFSLNFHVGELKYWKCVNYAKYKCLGRCVTSGNEIKSSNEHNHVSSIAEIEAKNVISDIKSRALATSESPKQIVATSVSTLTPAVIGQLPSVNGLKKAIQRSRAASNFNLLIPTSLDKLKIPDFCQITSKGEEFLLFDSNCNKRILLFSTYANLQHLSESKLWFADGTFKIAPKFFSQVYTIHFEKGGIIIPAIYALLPDKSEDTYVRLFNQIKILKPDISPPEYMTTDFEQAAINAFKKIYNSTAQHGCYFHFSQAIWRKIQSISEVLIKYKTDPSYALSIKMLASLAFIPENEVIATYELLAESEFYVSDPQLSSLLDYFEDTWIGRPTGRFGNRRSSLFPTKLWNCYATTMEGLRRTNNNIEGFHRGFDSLLQATHPSIWKLIEALKKEQGLSEMKIEHVSMGISSQPQRKIYRNSNDRILSVMSNYSNMSKLDFLRAIAQNIEYYI